MVPKNTFTQIAKNDPRVPTLHDNCRNVSVTHRKTHFANSISISRRIRDLVCQNDLPKFFFIARTHPIRYNFHFTMLFSTETMLLAIAIHLEECHENFLHSRYKKTFYQLLSKAERERRHRRIPRCALLSPKDTKKNKNIME